MSEERRTPPDGIEPALAAWIGAQGTAAAGNCPDENLLAAYASRTALPAERERLEAHLIACRACRATIATAWAPEPDRASAPAPQRSARRRRRHVLATLTGLAALLLVGWLVVRAGRTPTQEPSTEALLTASFSDLAKAYPDAFASTRPLTRAERLARGGTLERGGVVLEEPAGTILDPRPRVVWRGGRSARVVISTASGTRLGEAVAARSPLDWPPTLDPLEPGTTYLLEIEAAGTLGPERLSRSFRVASDEERERYARQVATASADVAAPLRSLVLAHAALRANLLAEARRHAEAYVAARPDDVLGRETLYQLRTRLGDPRAFELDVER